MAGVPATLLGVFVIVGIVVMDLTFDLGGDAATTRAYYVGHRTVGMPGVLLIPAAIVLGFVPLAQQLMSAQRHALDVVSLLVSLVSLGVFVGMLIPQQEALIPLSADDPATAVLLDAIKKEHLGLLVLLVVTTACQLRRHAVTSAAAKPKQT